MSTISPSIDSQILATQLSALEIAGNPPEDEDVLSAIERIPNELLCEIFTLTLPCTRHVVDQTLEQPPWWLGHICQRWRAAVLENPLFWSSITLYEPPARWMGQACPPLMIKTQLDRSGTAPLAVSFDARHDDIVGKSVDILIEQSFRWESLHLRASGTVVPRLCNRLQRVEGRVPMLRYLESIGFPEYLIQKSFSTVPSLRAVVLGDDDHYALSVSPSTHFPWSRITKFRGTYDRFQDCAAMFKAAPNLVECGITLRTAHSSDGPHVVLPHLLRLDAVGTVLNYLTAPLLEELWVSDTAPTALIDFVERSSCHLRKLVVYECSDPSALIPIFRAIPTLTTFFVAFGRTSGYMGEEFLFDALKINAGIESAEICPNLTHIAAGGRTGFAVDSFLDMVQTRRSVGQPMLSFVRVFYPDKRQMPAMIENVVRRIAEMKREGLDAALDIGLQMSQQNYLGMGRP
ncbi:hypothetical protein DFH08DRAFT_439134 [Mycena albidolilacea]|uniref:F-box domain-containing protein n=1 Tax=Mycena albidolilacea TaxID=1033008 RepID=A0AAD7AGD6_9AGAR|nr:hypothetical protein DFH08DRAFT_439134 [Mycena albidolilacea]